MESYTLFSSQLEFMSRPVDESFKYYEKKRTKKYLSGTKIVIFKIICT